MSCAAFQTNTSAQATTGRTYAYGVWFVGAATAGTIILRDGGSGGTIVATFNTPGITTSGTTASGYIPFPEGGLNFSTNMYVALSTTAFVTVFYNNVPSA